MATFWALCVLQCSVILVLCFGDVGFDKPGRFGLDFSHFLLLLLLQAGLFVAAVGMAIRRRRWGYSAVQVLLLVITAVAVLVVS